MIQIINEDAIMMSLHPWWIYQMALGKKTWEIRSRMPKVDLPCKVYLYCTKSFGKATDAQIQEMFNSNFAVASWSGRVVASFVIDKTEKFHIMLDARASECIKVVCNDISVEKDCCVPKQDLYEYIGTCRPGYALHISEFQMLPTLQNYEAFAVKTAPQYYCKVNKGIKIEKNDV